MKTSPRFVLAAVLLWAHPLRAEPDQLARLVLGIRSVPVRFTPPKDGQVYQLAIAKFENGQFAGYCEMPGATNVFHPTPKTPDYALEFAWTRRDGQDGFLVVTPSWSQNFAADPFFGHPLGITRYFAYGEPPREKLGPFLVLGLAVGGDPGGPPPADEHDIKAWLKKYPDAVVFLLAPFDTVEQAGQFARSMPALSAD